MRIDRTASAASAVEFDDVTVEAETEKALLCRIGEHSVWVPKSQISEDSEIQGADDEGTLIVSRWIAEQKNLV